MSFKKSFSQRLINDLENGKYGSANEFASGITRHYIASIKLNAPTTFGPTLPAQIPLTLPAPAQLGAPAAVGPTQPVTANSARQKLFYNTVKTYFVAKEISRGKVQVRLLISDIKSTINEYKRVTKEIKELHEQIDTLDNRLEALRKDIQSIIPEMKKFIQSKKDVVKQVGDEFDALKVRYKQLREQGLSDFDFETVLADELNDLNFFKNLKIQPSIRYQEITSTFNEIKNLLDRSTRTAQKYQNIFTKEANLKIYVRKKITAVTKEILDLLSGLIAPERFTRLWRDLTYIPGGKRIGAIMLRIINQNKVLKDLKKRLLAKVEALKKSVITHLNRKIDTLQTKLEEQAQYVINRLKTRSNTNKFKEKTKVGKILANILKSTKQAIKYVLNIIKHALLVLNEITSVVAKLAAIYNSIRQGIEKSKKIAEEVKNRYREIDASIQASKSKLASQARQEALASFEKDFNIYNLAQGDRPTETLVNKIGDSSPILIEVLKGVNSVLNLNDKQLAAFLRKRTSKATALANQIESLLTKDIPRLQVLFTANPNASNYKARLALANKITQSPDGSVGVATVFVSGKGEHKTYLQVVKQTKLISLKLKEFQDKLTIKISEQTKNLTNVTKNKDAVLDYIDTIIETKPKLKKIKNKKRRIQQDKAEIQRKVQKYKKLAKQARIAYRLLDGARTIVTKVAQDKKAPITNNERATRNLVVGFCDLQIERGKMTKESKKTTLKKFDTKLADLRAYETIYSFFNETLKEARAGKLVDNIKQELGDKVESFDERTRTVLQGFLDVIEGTQETPSISQIATIPLDVFNQTNIATAFVRAEKKAFARLQKRVGNISQFIPQNTSDPILLFVKRSLDKASSILLFLLKVVAKAFKAIADFLSKLIRPISDFVKKTISRETEKLEDEAARRANALLERKTNVDGRVMSLMFGLASRLFWTGTTWSNSAGTRFVVLNVGKFNPIMKASNENGSQGYGDELAAGLNNQLKNMSGLVIPLPAYGIVPFTFRGYVPLQGEPPIDVNNAAGDAGAPLNNVA
jgi:hypothetical protein